MSHDSTLPVPVGIDLGSTQSAACLMVGGKSQVVRDSLGMTLLPSALYFREEGVIVGRDAHKARQFDPTHVAISPKRDVGRPHYRRLIRGHQFPPEVLQACLLRELKARIEKQLPVAYQAAVSVPAYYDDARRRSTVSAIAMADLPFVDLVTEPMAAALAFGEYHGYLSPSCEAAADLTLLVYDLGGGTFDVTLLKLLPGQVRVLGTDGDVSLGGQDWDQRLADYLAQKFEAQFRIDPRDDERTMARLWELAHGARESLSSRHSVVIPIEFSGRSREVPVNREQLELLTADLLERTIHTTRELLQRCHITWQQVDRLLLAGGATRMPAVATALRSISKLMPDQTVNPDEAVARGAAIFAAYRLGQATGNQSPLRVDVIDVAAHSLGMEGVDPTTGRKEHKVLIPRNTPLPTKVVHPFTIRWSNQPSVVVKILEGESVDPSACCCIGQAVLDDLPSGLRRGQPVQVVFDMPRNGSLDVRLQIPGVAEDLRLKLEKSEDMPAPVVNHWRGVLQGPGRFATFEDMLRQVLGLQSVPSSAN